MITFIETKLFTKLVEQYLSHDSYRQLQTTLASDPEAGPLIPGSGGLRKLRWGISGRGKRGGLRIVYYVRLRQDEIWLLTLYPKNVAENIPSHILRKIKQEIDDEKPTGA
jgi:mRNA-degrading endonuclease RelE of RelBE toxin-antitoxin system